MLGATVKSIKRWRGVGGRAQRLPPNALVARNALQMLTWRSFVVVVVVVVIVVVVFVVVVVAGVVVVLVAVLGCYVPGFIRC